MIDEGQATYQDAFRSAYEGELIGATLYAQLSGDAGDSTARCGFAAIAEVERITFEALGSAAQRQGISVRGDYVRSVVQRRAAELSGLSWSSFVALACRKWPEFVIRFQALRRTGPASDRLALDRLVEHEIALVHFVEASRAGDALEVAAGSLRNYCDNTRAMLAAVRAQPAG